MCVPKAPRASNSAPPPPPERVADSLTIRSKSPASVARDGKSSLVIPRAVGGFDGTGSGLTIGRN